PLHVRAARGGRRAGRHGGAGGARRDGRRLPRGRPHDARRGPAAHGVTDVVVVGSGSSGSVVARRLADAGAEVLLLEAGGPDDTPEIHDRAGSQERWDAREDWGHRTVPQRYANDRCLHLPRGRVLGGSSCLNGMIYVRGAPSDYDGWAAEGWAWADLLRLF